LIRGCSFEKSKARACLNNLDLAHFLDKRRQGLLKQVQRETISSPHELCDCRLDVPFARFSRGEDMNHWIDLLIVIPSWLGVFAGIAVVVASVVSG